MKRKPVELPTEAEIRQLLVSNDIAAVIATLDRIAEKIEEGLDTITMAIRDAAIRTGRFDDDE